MNTIIETVSLVLAHCIIVAGLIWVGLLAFHVIYVAS